MLDRETNELKDDEVAIADPSNLLGYQFWQKSGEANNGDRHPIDGLLSQTEKEAILWPRNRPRHSDVELH
jgi:hypothetical protein